MFEGFNGTARRRRRCRRAPPRAARSASKGTYRERYGHEHRDNGWEVRLLRQAERLRKELVDPRSRGSAG